MPASTLLDIGTAALTSIGQLGRGQSPSPEDAATILRRGNLLLRKWSARRLYLFNIGTRRYTLQVNVADYTVGPSAATFGTTRPNFIESVQVEVAPGSDSWETVTILDKAQWDAIRAKDAVARLPERCWPEPSYPNYGLHFNPKPSGTPDIKLGCWEALTEFATVFSTIDLPPVYEAAFEPALAIELCGDYDQPITQSLQARYTEGMSAMLALNAQGLGGALGEGQKLQSPNVGQPLPAAAPPGGPAA